MGEKEEEEEEEQRLRAASLQLLDSALFHESHLPGLMEAAEQQLLKAGAGGAGGEAGGDKAEEAGKVGALLDRASFFRVSIRLQVGFVHVPFVSLLN